MTTLVAIPSHPPSPAPGGKSRVFLVDDHPLVREWLGTLVNQENDLRVCGQAGSASAALEAIRESQPDAAVVDLTLAQGSGLDLVKEIKAVSPRTAIVVFSMHEESLYAERVLRAGARAYVMKSETPGMVLSALRRVIEGGLFMSERVAGGIAGKFISGKPAAGEVPVASLSDRELQVFEMLGQGLKTRRIGELLQINIKTVQAYCARIKAKINVHTANELIREAIRWQESRRAAV